MHFKSNNIEFDWTFATPECGSVLKSREKREKNFEGKCCFSCKSMGKLDKIQRYSNYVRVCSAFEKSVECK